MAFTNRKSLSSLSHLKTTKSWKIQNVLILALFIWLIYKNTLGGDRTHVLRLIRPVLHQLSYQSDLIYSILFIIWNMKTYSLPNSIENTEIFNIFLLCWWKMSYNLNKGNYIKGFHFRYSWQFLRAIWWHMAQLSPYLLSQKQPLSPFSRFEMLKLVHIKNPIGRRLK